MRRAHAGLTGLCNLQLQHHGTPWCSRLSAAVTREGCKADALTFRTNRQNLRGPEPKGHLVVAINVVFTIGVKIQKIPTPVVNRVPASCMPAECRTRRARQSLLFGARTAGFGAKISAWLAFRRCHRRQATRSWIPATKRTLAIREDYIGPGDSTADVTSRNSRFPAGERRWRVVWENHVRCSPETMLVVAKP